MWADNLETEMVIIRDLVEDYPYVAMVRPIYLSRLGVLCMVCTIPYIRLCTRKFEQKVHVPLFGLVV